MDKFMSWFFKEPPKQEAYNCLAPETTSTPPPTTSTPPTSQSTPSNTNSTSPTNNSGSSSPAAKTSSWTPTAPSESSSQHDFSMLTKVRLEDFDIEKQIGEGSFGQVMKVKKKDNGKVFAMKILVKRLIAAMNEIEHTKSERNIMSKFARLQHPFIANIHYCFQTEERLYFIIDYINGGHLYYHLQKYGPFDPTRAQLYSAEILLALQHLHQNHVVYRDLKAENVLIAIDGHVRLTDFGLSKELKKDNERATTFCGTSEYLAPELLQGAAYGKEVDFWAYGVLLYEMLNQYTPFAGGEDITETYSLILHSPVDFPESIPASVIPLLENLLQKNPQNRLTDPEEIKKSEWFSDLSWEKVLKKETTPTFFPAVSGPDDDCLVDDSEFTTEDEKMAIVDGFEPDGDVSKRFRGFTYYPDQPK